jgi:hypothetical protein
MARRIKVRGVPKQEPDVRLYALALIELARQLQEEEEEAIGGAHEPRTRRAPHPRGGTAR